MTTLRLELRGIRKAYPAVVANDDVSLRVAPGEIHAVLGENGAGKSTLMKVIYGAVRPDAGEMHFNGQQVQVASADQPGLPGTVLARSYLGERLEVLVQTAAGPFKGTARGDSPLAEGDAVRLQLDPAQAAALQDEGDGF